jgi:two-component system sensor histidine kinase/response regulator
MDDSDVILDVEVLRKLESIMPREQFVALAGSYLNGVAARSNRIAALVAGRDLTGIGREAHDLKSTSGTFGARRLQRLGEQLEAACRERALDTIVRLAAAIAALVPETIEAALRRYPEIPIDTRR